jgi:protein phosphatase PTC1
MEDAAVAIDCFGGDAGTGYFAVYDGHGGRNIAEFLRLHLHLNIEKELQQKGDRSIEECLSAAFLITDLEANATGEQAAGSTAAVCIVRRQGNKRYIYSANCGDARSVLMHNSNGIRLSKDHKIDDEAKAYIERQGGFVLRKRVMGVLAVSRAFGDFALKRFVPATPHTTTTKIDAMSQFLIIACDGVWDVLEDQDAVDLIRAHIGPLEYGAPVPTSKAKTAAQVLVDASLARGSMDNVTVLVVFL